MSTVIGRKCETPREWRELVAYVLAENPDLIKFWEGNASEIGATQHAKNLVRYGHEYLKRVASRNSAAVTLSNNNEKRRMASTRRK